MKNSKATLRLRSILFALFFFLVGSSECQAVFFDLRGLSPADGFAYNLSKDGVSIQLHGSPTLRSGATSFGVDSPGANDSPTLVDGGNGIKEQCDISFPSNEFFQSIQISQFTDVDSGTLTVKGVRTIQLANGVIDVSAIPTPTSANTVAWTGDTISGQDRGFSVDGLTVILIPEPSTLALTVAVTVALPVRRRRQPGN